MVNVEIDDGEAPQIVRGTRVEGGHRDIVEKTKPHRAAGRCVMTRWAYRTKSVVTLTGHHRIARGDAGSGSTQRRPA